MKNLSKETDLIAQRGRAILSLLGTFWTELHADRRLMQMYGKSLGEILANRYSRFMHAVSTLGRKNMPLFKRNYISRITLKQSESRSSSLGVLKYGQDAVYSQEDVSQKAFFYGQQMTGAYPSAPIDKDIVHIGALVDRPLNPSIVLVGGTDFWVDKEMGLVVFRRDPFVTDGMPVVDILSENTNNVVDREVSLWAIDSLSDARDISDKFGAILDIDEPSTPMLHLLINAALDMVCSGPSIFNATRIICAMAGVRCSEHDGEVVVDIDVGHELTIATTHDAYVFDSGDMPAVKVGDTLSRGTILTDAIRICRTPESIAQTMPGYTIDRAFGRSLKHPISLPSMEMPIALVEDNNGRSKIAIELVGDEKTARSYWDAVHDAGVASGKTLAEHMDIRSAPTGQPDQASLPHSVNPLSLICRESAGNWMVVTMRRASFGRDACCAIALRLLKRLLPPRMKLTILVEDIMDMDYYRISGTSEELDAHHGSDVESGIVSGLVDLGPSAWIVGDPCGTL